MKAFKKALQGLRQQVRDSRAPAGVSVSVAPPPEPEPDFRQLFRDVKPLKPDGRHAAPRAKPSPHPRRRHAQEPVSEALQQVLLQQMVGWFEPAEIDAHFARPGMPSATLKKLRAGFWPVTRQLDLHGCDRYQAQDALALFLHQARRHGPCVRVIHGKGFGSNGQPVLKRMVRAWLKHHPDVLAFCEAGETMGGAGALLVLLRREHAP